MENKPKVTHIDSVEKLVEVFGQPLPPEKEEARQRLMAEMFVHPERFQRCRPFTRRIDEPPHFSDPET